MRIHWVVKTAIVAGVLIYAAGYTAPTTQTTPTPAAPAASTPDCFTVPTDGQSHPCSIPDPPVTVFTVITHGAYQPDAGCWSISMHRPTPGGSETLRTCVPKADYDAHPVGSTYTVGGPGTGLPAGTATRVTDGS